MTNSKRSLQSSSLQLTIGYLYGDLMNIYGDTGNIICLQKRCELRGIKVKVKPVSLKEKIKKGDIDLYFFGGGQDESQIEVSKDLQRKDIKKTLTEDIERGVPLLSICGGYQLLGDYYQPQKGPKLPGLGVFPAFTQGGEKRMIGGIVLESAFGEIVGFENHSGKTFLKEGTPLGMIRKGFGNNGEDQTEGCIYKNAIGCYMHGSLLPKNPKLADWLIKKALEIKYQKEMALEELDDSLENKAHFQAVKKLF